MLTFDSHYIPIKVISKPTAIVVSHSHLFQVISKQAATMVSYHTACCSWENDFIFFTLFSPYFSSSKQQGVFNRGNDNSYKDDHHVPFVAKVCSLSGLYHYQDKGLP